MWQPTLKYVVIPLQKGITMSLLFLWLLSSTTGVSDMNKWFTVMQPEFVELIDYNSSEDRTGQLRVNLN